MKKKNMLKGLRKHSLYRVTFYDHSIGGSKEDPAVVCTIVGWLTGRAPVGLMFTYWAITNPRNDEEFHHNAEQVFILEACIIEIKLIKGNSIKNRRKNGRDDS